MSVRARPGTSKLKRHQKQGSLKAREQLGDSILQQDVLTRVGGFFSFVYVLPELPFHNWPKNFGENRAVACALRRCGCVENFGEFSAC